MTTAATPSMNPEYGTRPLHTFISDVFGSILRADPDAQQIRVMIVFFGKMQSAEKFIILRMDLQRAKTIDDI